MRREVKLSVFILLTSIVSYGQQLFDYAVIDFHPYTREMAISITGEPHQLVSLKKSDFDGHSDVTPILLKVKSMEELGWELFNNTTSGGDFRTRTFTFYLRKKE